MKQDRLKVLITRGSPTPTAQAAVPALLVFYWALTQLSFIPVSVKIGQDLGMSEAAVGLAVGAHPLATGAASVLAGPLLDLLRARLVLVPATVLSVGVSLWMCLDLSTVSLVAGRALSGLFTGVATLCAFTLVTDRAGDDVLLRDRGFSLLQVFTAVGAMTALGLGAAAAQLEIPFLVFVVSAVYGVVLLILVLVTPFPPRVGVEVSARAESSASAWATRVRAVFGQIAAMLAQPRMAWLMLCALVVGVVIQGGHYGVSVLLEHNAGELTVWQRVLLSMIIPFGVFTGSSINRRALKRVGRERLYAVLYLVLPFAVVAYAASTSFGAPMLLTAAGLLCVGTCLGAMMPLSSAIAVGWNVELRGSATAAEALARSIGQTAGPVVVGVVVTLASINAAVAAMALIAVFGTCGSLLMAKASRRVDDHDSDPAAPTHASTDG